MTRIAAAFSLLFISISVFAQNIPLYKWRSHIPYLQGMQVLEAGKRIYCATQTGLFYYDKSDNTEHDLSKVDGYSDIFVKTMAYAPKHDILFIAYQNGNLDMVHAGKVTNYNGFENQLTINSIYIDSAEDIAYFSNPVYGIYEWDINSGSPHLFYSPNTQPNIYKVAILGNYLYECSATGVKRVRVAVTYKSEPDSWQTISTDSCGNLVPFHSKIVGAFQNGILEFYNDISGTWTVMHRNQNNKRIQNIESNNGILVMTGLDSIYVYSNLNTASYSYSFQQGNDAIADEQGTIWMAQNIYVLLSHKNGDPDDKYRFYQPGGLPTTYLGNQAFGYHNQVWVSAGRIDNDGSHGFDNHGFYMYDGETWHNYNQQTDYGKSPDGSIQGPDIRDFMGMAVDTVTNHLWIGTLDSGIAEFDATSNTILNIYNAGNTNNKLKPIDLNPTKKYIPAADVKFDHEDNLWAVSYNDYGTAKQQLIEKKHNGDWEPYTVGPMSNVNSLIVDDYDDVWLIDSRDNTGVVVFNPSTNKNVTLGTAAGSGGLPSAHVNCGIKDKNGEIWLGTTAGPCVYSDPSLLFGNTNYDVQRPYISSGNNAGYLLGALGVTAIAVDGADRKWFGTSDGVWLTSAEGDKILQHFDITNSPLVSNQINAIAINGVSGEVFFVTDKGIVSYRGAATDGGNGNEGVYAFPNPVRPGYSGPITIKGLVTDANVKITDVTGSLVYETTALGGEATWNGRNFSGREANSGVYLVFITNSDGSQTAITKILIVR